MKDHLTNIVDDSEYDLFVKKLKVMSTLLMKVNFSMEHCTGEKKLVGEELVYKDLLKILIYVHKKNRIMESFSLSGEIIIPL